MQWTKLAFEENRCKILTPGCAALIADCEVGRWVKSERRAKRSYRNLSNPVDRCIAWDLLIPPSKETCLSVDCLGVVGDEQLAEIALEEMTDQRKKFFGWYVLTISDIYANQCQLKFSPNDKNPYHADIVFPADPRSNDLQGGFKQTANDLATCAHFRPYGDWVKSIGFVGI